MHRVEEQLPIVELYQYEKDYHLIDLKTVQRDVYIQISTISLADSIYIGILLTNLQTWYYIYTLTN